MPAVLADVNSEGHLAILVRIWLSGNRSRGGEEGDRSMFSACVSATKMCPQAEKWTSPPPPRGDLDGPELFSRGFRESRPGARRCG